MTKSLQNSRESKNCLFLILSFLERTIQNLRKCLTDSQNFLEAYMIDNAAANSQVVTTIIDEMKQPKFNQLKQITYYHHQKQHHKDKPNQNQKLPRIFQGNLQQLSLRAHLHQPNSSNSNINSQQLLQSKRIMPSDQALLKRKRKLLHLLVKKVLLSNQHRKRACIEEITFLLILMMHLKFKFMINQRFSRQFHSNNQRSKVITSHPNSNQLLLNNMVNHLHHREVQSL